MKVNATYRNTKLRSIFWLIAAALIVTVLVAAVRNTANTVCKNVEISIVGDAQQFISTNTIAALINESSIKGRLQGEIDLRDIEKKINQNLWVAKSEVYFSDKNTLKINVTQRVPLYRLFTTAGISYFVDAENKVLPLSSETITKLPVFTNYTHKINGTAVDSALLAPMQYLASKIKGDEFWMAQIQQIDIVNENQFEIIPTIGNHVVLFGDTFNTASKLNKLKKYYGKVASVIGFDKYKYLNVKFKDQVIGTNEYVNILDSAEMRRNVRWLLENGNDTALLNKERLSQRDTIQTLRISRPAVLPANANQNIRSASRPVARPPSRPTATVPNRVATRPNATPRTPPPRATTPNRPTTNNRVNNNRRN